jgi:hypothetical protein
MMAYNSTKREGNCPWGHAAGCAKHGLPILKGKAFALTDYAKELTDLGLTKRRKELEKDVERGHPPGTPKKVGDTLVYPARHFA